MLYLKNNGRYAYAFMISLKGRETKIELDRRRVYFDTGNVATTGITPVAEEVFAELKKQKRFKALFDSKEIELTEESALETSESKLVALQKENQELKAQLNAKPTKETKTSKKEIEAKDAEIASLKAQLESLTKKADTETEGF